jgi:hypothetical protein
MRPSRNIRALLVGGLLTFAAMVAICFAIAERFAQRWSQNVRGTIMNAGKPVPNCPVRISGYRRDHPCEGPSPHEAVTDTNGHFALARPMTGSWLSNFVVLVQLDELCVRTGASWRSLWADPYGPAPTSLTFLCDLVGPPPGAYLKLPSERCWIEDSR